MWPKKKKDEKQQSLDNIKEYSYAISVHDLKEDDIGICLYCKKTIYGSGCEHRDSSINAHKHCCKMANK